MMFDDFVPTPEMLAELPADQRAAWVRIIEGYKWRDERIAACIADRNFDEALALTDSKLRAQLLCGLDLEDAEIADLLTHWWSMTEAWSGIPELRTKMLEMLERVRPLIVPNEDDPADGLPPGLLTIYRGNLGERPGTGSWTLDPEMAERFARMAKSPRGMFLGMYREDGWPTVWRAEIDSADVLGYFNDRHEHEIVVKEDDLRDVLAIRAAVRD